MLNTRRYIKTLRKLFFSLQKSKNEFSRMALDQVHGQNNKGQQTNESNKLMGQQIWSTNVMIHYWLLRNMWSEGNPLTKSSLCLLLLIRAKCASVTSDFDCLFDVAVVIFYHVYSLTSNFERVYLVFDRYFEQSLKNTTKAEEWA